MKEQHTKMIEDEWDQMIERSANAGLLWEVYFGEQPKDGWYSDNVDVYLLWDTHPGAEDDLVREALRFHAAESDTPELPPVSASLLSPTGEEIMVGLKMLFVPHTGEEQFVDTTYLTSY